jgi:uncharacterized membrane protein YcaP (DUF421 family)
MHWEPIDWHKLFVPTGNPLEIVIRGTVVYLALFLMLRLVLKRQAGAMSVTDLLFIVLIADAAQNSMAGQYHSIPDGLLLVGTILLWSHFLDWLGYHFRWVGRLTHPPPLPLIKNGKLLRHNMRKELVTLDELMTQLREQGINDISEVTEACMEGDGRISAIKRTGEQHTPKQSTPGAG